MDILDCVKIGLKIKIQDIIFKYTRKFYKNCDKRLRR